MGLVRLYLVPGFFGFRSIGGFEYFAHVERALRERLTSLGRAVEIHVVDVHPTASIRRRASMLRDEVDRTWKSGDSVHFVGHSTGGLDARLVASPHARLDGPGRRSEWLSSLRSVITINTPHFGTPLANFFATVNGQRMLFAVSALTVSALRVGAPPIAVATGLAAAFGRIDRAVGLELKAIDRLVERAAQTLDDASSQELHTFLERLREDQGAILQLSPEAMDLFGASVSDHPGAQYSCVASHAPDPGVIGWALRLVSPWSVASGALFATLHRLARTEHDRYPCAPPDDSADRALRTALGSFLPRDANDGVVPTHSQVWGRLLWAGKGDHLEVVGHFRGGRRAPEHRDWMSSSSRFTTERFREVMNAIAGAVMAAALA